jgi:serine/threonine protein kinase
MESDSTQVTSSAISTRGPRRGTVLGERYEILDAVDGDALGLVYKALDQESESHVLLRLPAPGALGEKDARSLVTRLSPLVGIGGRTIARVRDVDREGSLVFVIEPWPTGTTLRSILEARRNKNSIFSTQELLPVVVALAEATMAIPAPWFHGDLRPHRIYLSAEGVRVTGGFALAVLPGDIVVDALHDDVGLRRQFAPEVGDGLAGKPADRWSVAAIAWEALTGRLPEPGPKDAPEAVTELGKVLLRYLDPDPTLRPPTLDLLVTALAKHASLPAPKLVPEPFVIDNEPAHDDRTQQIDPSELKPADTGKSPGATRPTPAINDTAKMQALVLADPPTTKDSADHDLSDIDPALLKAAALNRKMSESGTFKLDAGELEPVGPKQAKKKEDSGELDPRLVRAALSVDGGTDPRAEPAPKAMPRPAARKNTPKTEELDAVDLEENAPRAKAAAAPKPTPAPKPMPAPTPMPVSAAMPAPRPMPAPVVHVPVATAPPPVVPAPRPFAAQPETRIDRPLPPEPRSNGTLVIAIAVGIAVTILVLAFWYRSAQQEAARARRIDEQVRQIQGQ